ncbi:MAG TPA: glycosyltransferase family 2 protein [Planctomycetota bacterium]|nr:glycosyltransferase family 2 protein [Planctomycetota bacterium]
MPAAPTLAAVLEALLAAALGALALTFAIYPVAIGLLARLRGRAHAVDGGLLPAVTVIVAAHDEAVVIGAKCDNILGLDYPPDRLDAVVVSDGSTDGTDEIVRARGGARIRLLRQEPRQGKAAALGRAIAAARGEVLVFTDANVLFDREAVRRLVRHFADPAVGVVTGTVHLIDGKPGYAQSEGLYYRYERFLQRSESTYDSVVGVDGALYAVRRDLAQAPPPDVILDDFLVSMDVAARGGRIIYDPTAEAWEDAAPSVEQEFRRKSRVAMGAFQLLGRGLAVPPLERGRLLFCWAGHKLLRWVAPWALLAAFAASVALAREGPLFAGLAWAQVAFYAVACAGLAFPAIRGWRPVAVPTYFTLMNAAFAWGLIRLLRGDARGTWQKVDRRLVEVGELGHAA